MADIPHGLRQNTKFVTYADGRGVPRAIWRIGRDDKVTGGVQPAEDARRIGVLVENTARNSRVIFMFTSPDGVTWTQLGDEVLLEERRIVNIPEGHLFLGMSAGGPMMFGGCSVSVTTDLNTLRDPDNLPLSPSVDDLPATRVVSVGGTITIPVTGSGGSGALHTVSWFKDDVFLHVQSGGPGAPLTLIIENAQLSDSGNYRVIGYSNSGSDDTATACEVTVGDVFTLGDHDVGDYTNGLDMTGQLATMLTGGSHAGEVGVSILVGDVFDGFANGASMEVAVIANENTFEFFWDNVANTQAEFRDNFENPNGFYKRG